MWRVADLGGVELLRATLTEFTFRPHAHEEYFIALTEAGRCVPTYRGGRHAIGPGDLIVLNPEEAHAGGPPAEDSWTYRSLYVRPELLAKPGVTLPRFRKDVIRDGELTTWLRRFHQLCERAGPSILEREVLLAGALALLASRHAAPPLRSGSLASGSLASGSPAREPIAVRLSREYLEEHAAENVTLSDLAGAAGLSAFHLCRVFGAAVGMPPHAYLTHIRVRRAKSLLRDGAGVSQVAAATGFYDQAHLTRHFKRIVGVTPARYPAADRTRTV